MDEWVWVRARAFMCACVRLGPGPGGGGPEARQLQDRSSAQRARPLTPPHRRRRRRAEATQTLGGGKGGTSGVGGAAGGGSARGAPGWPKNRRRAEESTQRTRRFGLHGAAEDLAVLGLKSSARWPGWTRLRGLPPCAREMTITARHIGQLCCPTCA
jgi:hypothetical protein